MQPTIILLTNQHNSLLPQIIAIEKQSFSRPWSLHHFTVELQNPFSLSYVLIASKNIVGYLFSTAIDDEYQINKLCVATGSKNAGFGTLLLNNYIENVRSRNGKAIFLEVKERNSVAVHVYQKAGFKILRTRYKNYDDMYNALEMKYEIMY